MPRDEANENPEEKTIAADEARAAHQRRDWAEAARLWASYCDRFGDDPNGFISAAEALVRLSRIDEAEELLAKGLRAHPGMGPIKAAYARVAERRSDWAQALDRWQKFLDRYPDDPSGYRGVGDALNQLAQVQLRQADEVVWKGVERHPANGDLLGTYARLATSRRQWLEGLARWRTYLDRLAADPTGYAGACSVLCELGRFDEAEDCALLGLATSPHHHGLLSEYARVAFERHDWSEALKRWTAFRERFPDDPEGYKRVRLILNELGHFTEADRGFERALSQSGPDKGTADLFLCFESLGDNCEFGVVQRYYGADPLGLLRFTFTPLGLLCEALQSKFAGVGEPENTILFGSRGEWITKDTRYHMSMHTMLRENASDHDRTFGLICRRLQYLRDKLLADLTEGRKHLVYACRENLHDDEVRPLWQALRAYGDNRLLFVRLADDLHPPGMLRHIEDGLIIGYIDQLSVDNPSYELWLQLCKEADSIWSAGTDFGELIEPVAAADLHS